MVREFFVGGGVGWRVEGVDYEEAGGGRGGGEEGGVGCEGEGGE